MKKFVLFIIVFSLVSIVLYRFEPMHSIDFGDNGITIMKGLPVLLYTPCSCCSIKCNLVVGMKKVTPREDPLGLCVLILLRSIQVCEDAGRIYIHIVDFTRVVVQEIAWRLGWFQCQYFIPQRACYQPWMAPFHLKAWHNQP